MYAIINGCSQLQRMRVVPHLLDFQLVLRLFFGHLESFLMGYACNNADY